MRCTGAPGLVLSDSEVPEDRGTALPCPCNSPLLPPSAEAKRGEIVNSRNPTPLLVVSLAQWMTHILGKRGYSATWEMKRPGKEFTGWKCMETVPLNPCCTDIYFCVADTLGHFKPQQVPGGFQLGHISSWASTAEEATPCSRRWEWAASTWGKCEWEYPKLLETLSSGVAAWFIVSQFLTANLP